MKSIKWIYKCGNDWNYCKDGFCNRYNQLKEEHERPAVEMSKEWLKTTGEKWSPSAISTKFGDLTSSKPASCETGGNYSQLPWERLGRCYRQGNQRTRAGWLSRLGCLCGPGRNRDLKAIFRAEGAAPPDGSLEAFLYIRNSMG
jgi:hypothetical protein